MGRAKKLQISWLSSVTLKPVDKDNRGDVSVKLSLLAHKLKNAVSYRVISVRWLSKLKPPILASSYLHMLARQRYLWWMPWSSQTSTKVFLEVCQLANFWRSMVFFAHLQRYHSNLLAMHTCSTLHHHCSPTKLELAGIQTNNSPVLEQCCVSRGGLFEVVKIKCCSGSPVRVTDQCV